MNTLIKRLLKVLLVFSLFTSLSMTGSSADPISVTLGNNNPFEDFRATSAGGAYQIDVAANGEDPVVLLYSGSSPEEFFNYETDQDSPNWLSTDDDGGPGLSSRLTGTLTEGTYTIRITWYGWWGYDVGDFQIFDDEHTYTLTYTGLTNVSQLVRARGNLLSVQSAPVLTQSGNTLTCKSSDFGMLNGGVTSQASAVQAVAYNLLIDGVLVSRVVGGSAASLPATLQPIAGAGYTGTATTSSATWDIGSKSNFTAQCQVVGWQSGANGTAASNVIDDSGKIAAAKAKADAEETARQAALVEFNSKENRELRKRLAARGIRG